MSSSPSPAKVLVIGAGIGGLTALIALRRAGLDAEIYERAPGLSAVQVGYGIHLWSNAMRALRAQGVAPAVEEQGEPFERMHFETVGGRTVFDWPLHEVTRELGEPIVGINRSHLHAVLVEAAGEDSIRFGKALVSLEQDGQGVTASFADGSEARGDVLIGADGVRSTVRGRLLDDGPASYLGLAERHATISLPEGWVPPRTFHEYWGGRNRFGFYPIKGGTCWYLLGPDAQGTEDSGGHKEAVLRRLEGWPEAARKIVDHTPAHDVVRLEVFVRGKTPHWAVDRVALLGDAAHAMEPSGGQGSAQAIEDAVVLARCLENAADLPGALAKYEQLRIPRVRTMHRVSTATGRIGRFYTPFVRPRNLVLPLVTPGMWKIHKRLLAFEP
jgi:FAD-dependent urate hydroxylase